MPDSSDQPVDPAESQEIWQKIKETREVPALPLSVMKLLNALKRESSTIQDIEEIIRHDQSIASRVIAVANSPFYYGRKGMDINSIDQAILLLGFKTISAIVISISIFKSFPLPYETIKKIWAHSYRVALASGFLASKIKGSDKDIAFTAGLLHDIGRAVLITISDKKDLSRLSDAFKNPDMIEIEKRLFRCNHTQAGYWFLKEYSVPDEILLPILYHHDIIQNTSHRLIIDPVFIAEGISGDLAHDNASDGVWNKDKERIALESGIDNILIEECKHILEIEEKFLLDYFEL